MESEAGNLKPDSAWEDSYKRWQGCWAPFKGEA